MVDTNISEIQFELVRAAGQGQMTGISHYYVVVVY